MKLRSTLTPNGDLAVDLAGVPNQFQPDYGNFLPGNTDANRPAGQGYVQFSVQLKSSVKVGTAFTQQGDILFNQHAFGGEDTPTNVWETTVVPNKHPLAGLSVVLGDKPGVPKSKKLTFKAVDAAVKGLADPTANGVTLFVRSNFDATLTAPATSSTDKYVLPAAGWVRYGTTKYVYKDPKLVRGPIKSATIDLRKGSPEAERKRRQAHALTDDHAEHGGHDRARRTRRGVREVWWHRSHDGAQEVRVDACSGAELLSDREVRGVTSGLELRPDATSRRYLDRRLELGERLDVANIARGEELGQDRSVETSPQAVALAGVGVNRLAHFEAVDPTITETASHLDHGVVIVVVEVDHRRGLMHELAVTTEHASADHARPGEFRCRCQSRCRCRCRCRFRSAVRSVGSAR